MLVHLIVIEILFIKHCALDSLWKTMPVPDLTMEKANLIMNIRQRVLIFSSYLSKHTVCFSLLRRSPQYRDQKIFLFSSSISSCKQKEST